MEEKLITNEQLSMELYQSLKRRTAMRPLTMTNKNLTVDDAYDIQMRNVKRALSEGEHLTGKKIGLTSKGMQQLLNITEPDFGHLFKSMEVENGGTVSMNIAIQPKVEGEVAFVLKEDLVGPNVTIEESGGSEKSTNNTKDPSDKETSKDDKSGSGKIFSKK